MNNATANRLINQLKQSFNRLTHAKKAHNVAQRRADKLRREYLKAAFILLYGQNQPHRNELTQAEVGHIRLAMNEFKRAFMAHRVISGRILPRHLTHNIIKSIV
jgi:hypothetical protein